MMPKHIDHVTIFWSYEDALEDVDDEKVELELRRAIMRYAFTGEDPELTGIARAMFKLLKPNLDSSRQKVIDGMKSKGNRNAKANDSHSIPETTNEQTVSIADTNQEHTMSIGSPYHEHRVTIPYADQKHTNKEKKKELGVEVGEGVEESTPQTPQGDSTSASASSGDTEVPDSSPPQPSAASKPARSRRFVKPTAGEVAAYAAERGRPNFDAARFIDHYESNGWMVGRTHMRDWKATVRTWLSREHEFSGNDPTKSQPCKRLPGGKPDIYTDWSAQIAEVKAQTAAARADAGG